MSELEKQVQRAQRRINMQSFLSACIWSLASCLGIAVIALAVTKIWHIGINPEQWRNAWLIGATLAGLIGALAFTWIRRRNMVEAAIEIDRRYGLKERVSSSLSLSPSEADTEVGRALISDAAKRVERIDVRDKFGVQANRWAALPLAIAALAISLVLIPDAKPGDASSQASAKTVEVKKVKNSSEQLKKKLAKKAQELEDKNLPEAGKLAKKLEHSIDKLNKSDSDKKKAMVEMNNLAKMMKQQRESMQGSKDLKQKLNQMKGMKVKEGPADKLAKAMQQGDFQKALEQVANLQKQMQEGKLSEKQMQQMAKQMDQMQKKMNDMVQKHEQAKKDLKKQMEQAQQQGNKAAAKQLQKKLEQMQAQDAGMKKMQQMAKQMEKMAQNMKQGNQQKAAQQMAEMAQDLKGMQQEMEELQAMDDLMDQLADAKDAMNCDGCDGEGCAMCQGMGNGFGQQGDMPGMGMGEGQGQGDRPEEKTNHNFYDSKVRAKPRRGQLVITGNVKGPNKPGEALEAIKEAMTAAETAEENPLVNVRLPRAQREQAQQYFDAVRSGANQ